ncbi:dienelactone hydrolase family protein [Streptomyces sp. NBC_00513]|uniref:alpha/beta hydrolase family protein n=2 Tax=unclassified Streptomyces TaxID=2593676 RepID=UPI00224FA395|nr:dienelactone hydrolase family protein [Streptomyces sp. NBC_00424]MCX5071262.1 dienelactone hydrolase family protein [Streptomyces sp. NBC_00424]WUD45322.1 dienelactone hydrolase family protein [Streptomyces sp. NBC_00513]
MTETITGLYMSPLELLASLCAVALVVARWLPPAARPRVTIVSSAVLVLSTIVLGVVGIRWQMLPVLAGAALALPFALSPLLRRRTGRPAWRARWWLALPGSVACVGLIATSPVAAWAFPVPEFPEPSGRFAVGTRVVQWTDPRRPESFTDDPNDRRTVVVQLWYPAQKSPADARRAQYLGRTEYESRTVSDALARNVGLPDFLVDGVPRARSHSVFDAPVASGGERFPVVLFSPGSGGVRTQNTAWAEELAGHGYVVAALDHPYDSAAVVLDDGRTIHSRTASTGDRDKDDKLAVDWTAVRAADLGFVLTQLDQLDRGETGGPLAGRLDTGQVAVTGHSMGGAAALQAARQDRRFDAVIDLDGYPHGPTSPSLDQPTLALTQAITPETDTHYIPHLTEALKRNTATSYRLTIPGAAHLTFMDGPLYLPPVPSIVGSLGRTESPHVVAATTLVFLDSTLRHKPGDLAGVLSTYGDLSIHPPDNRR